MRQYGCGGDGRFPDGLLMDLPCGELAGNRHGPFAGVHITPADDPNHPELPLEGPDPRGNSSAIYARYAAPGVLAVPNVLMAAVRALAGGGGGGPVCGGPGWLCRGRR